MKKILFLSAMVLVILTSCRPHSDAFPSALVSYFPYSENQQLVFANNNGDTTIMTVTDVYVSEEQWCRFGEKCLAPVEMWVQASNDSMQMKASMDAYSQSLGMGVNVGDVNYNKEIQGDPFSSEMLSEIGDTIRFTREGHKAIVVRYEGLVEFDDVQHDCTWKMIK